MAKLAELLNVNKEFKFKDKTYKLGEADIEQRGEFAAWVENNALEYLHRMQLNDKENRFTDFIEKALRSHVIDVAAGVYEWGGDAVSKATQTRMGQIQLLYIALKKHDPEITVEIAEKMLDDKYKEVTEKIKEVFNDPKLSAELAELKDIITSFGS